MSRKVTKNDNGEIAPEAEPNLTPVQAQAVTYLLCGLTQAWVAKELKIAPETISRWRHHSPHFIAALRRGQQMQAESVDYALSELALDAVNCLAELLKSKSPQVRLAAARAVLAARPAVTAGNISPERVATELGYKLKRSSIDTLLGSFEF